MATPKQELFQWLRNNSQLNQAVVETLVNSVVEADVIEDSLEITPTTEEQTLIPQVGHVWNEVVVVPAAIPMKPEILSFGFQGIEGEVDIDDENQVIVFTASAPIVDKTALVVEFTREDAPTLLGTSPIMGIYLDGEGSGWVSGTTTVDLSVESSMNLMVSTLYIHNADLDYNWSLNNPWTIQLDEPEA